MADLGHAVVEHVKPGPENPLGNKWIGLSIPAVGIHGTNQPASIYRFATHGCIRMHPDDVAEFFDYVTIGSPVRVIYEPILLSIEETGTFLEVHQDVYGKSGRFEEPVATILREARLDHLLGSREVKRATSERAGRAVRID